MAAALGLAPTPEVIGALAADARRKGCAGRAPLLLPSPEAAAAATTSATTTSAAALHALRRTIAELTDGSGAMTANGLYVLECGDAFRLDRLHAREASLVDARRATRAALPDKVTAHDPLALADALGLDRHSFGLERLRFPRWTSSLHRAARWVDDDLDADGKLLRDMPGERDALYSSFADDRVFREDDLKAKRVEASRRVRQRGGVSKAHVRARTCAPRDTQTAASPRRRAPSGFMTRQPPPQLPAVRSHSPPHAARRRARSSSQHSHK